MGSRKKAISGLHIREIADKKTAYNEDRLYSTIIGQHGKHGGQTANIFKTESWAQFHHLFMSTF